MRTPATALLWELWRHSRLYLASSVLFSSISGTALVVWFAGSYSLEARATFAALAAAYFATFGFMWVATVEERHGFVSDAGFTRPVRTWVLVTVPLAYVALTSAGAYLVPLLVLRAIFGLPHLHVELAAWVSIVSVAWVTTLWTSASRVQQVLGSIVVLGIPVGYVTYLMIEQARSELPPDRWLEVLRLTPAGYAVLVAIAIASTAVTIIGVARRRRGDGWITFRRSRPRGLSAFGRSTALARLAAALRVRCPVSSPTLAQLWFEVRNAGALVVASGMLTALAIPLFIALALAFGDGIVTAERRARNVAELSVLAPVVPLGVGVLLIGVRPAQGIAYLSAFDATRAMGSARLVALRVLATSLSTVLGWLAIGWSMWSFSLDRRFGEGGRTAIADLVATAPVHDLALLAWILVVQILTIFACASAIHVFLRLNALRVVIGAASLGLYLVALLYAITMGWLDGAAVLRAHAWIVAAGGVVGALYLYREAMVERILTPAGSITILATWLSFCAATLLLGRSSGRLGAGMDPDAIAPLIVFTLVPLVAAVLAPWSFSRIRHR